MPINKDISKFRTNNNVTIKHNQIHINCLFVCLFDGV
jgi:hypothetical protein